MGPVTDNYFLLHPDQFPIRLNQTGSGLGDPRNRH